MGPDSCSIKVFQSHTFLSVAEFGSFILPFLASIHSFKEFPYGKLYTAFNTEETILKNMLNQYCYSRLSHKSCTYPKLIGATLFRAKLFWFKIVAVSPAAGPEKWLATVQTDIPPPSLSLWWSSWWWCWFWSWWWRWWWGWSWWWGWLWGQGGGQKGKKSLQRKKSFPKKKCTGRTSRKNPPPFGNNPLPDQEAAGTPHLCQGDAHPHQGEAHHYQGEVHLHQGEVHHHQEEAQPPQLHTPSSKHLDGILQPWLHHQDPLSGTYAPKVVPVACASPILKPELFPTTLTLGRSTHLWHLPWLKYHL